MQILIIASVIGLAIIAATLFLPVWVARGERDVNGEPERDSKPQTK